MMCLSEIVFQSISTIISIVPRGRRAVDMGRARIGLMHCRSACAACCIAPSISSSIPGMAAGKPAGMPCVQLTADLRCSLFGDPRRPAVCTSLRPSAPMCGASAADAMRTLEQLERLTSPAA